jgi:hypothetical protein
LAPIVLARDVIEIPVEIADFCSAASIWISWSLCALVILSRKGDLLLRLNKILLWHCIMQTKTPNYSAFLPKL